VAQEIKFSQRAEIDEDASYSFPAESLQPSSSNTDSQSSTPTLDFDSLSLGLELPQDLTRLAYERFLYDFVIETSPGYSFDKHADSVWDFMPTLSKSSAEGSCVKTIIHAVAFANFRARCNAPRAQILAEQCRGQGLKMLRQRVADETMAATDESLAAVYLMGIHEVGVFRTRISYMLIPHCRI
jgi:hypothetical protein